MQLVKNTVVLLVLMLFAFSIQAQKKVWVKFGDESMEVHDAYSAAKFYKKAIAYDSTDQALNYKLSQAYLAYQNFPKALPIHLRLLKSEAAVQFPLLNYETGLIYKFLGQYDSSKVYFERFLKVAANTVPEKLWAKNELKNLPAVEQLIKDTANVDLQNIAGNVNTGDSEFGTVLLTDSSLLFTSLRATAMLEDGSIKPDDYFAKIYRAKKVDSTWLVQNALKIALPNKVSIANGSFNLDRSKFYFSVCEQFGACKIYEGEFKEDSLTNVKPLSMVINATGATSTHPHLVEISGKQLLIFSSNRTGGKGGMDLWVAEYKNDWQSPKNLGNTINSKGDELSPFFDAAKNVLYFSSNWHYNLGAFDVFKSTGSFPSKWEIPVNLGLPYNSNLNDLYFTLQDSLKGFLTSSREGSITEKDAACCNDIYSFEVEQKIIQNKEEKQKLVSTLHQHEVRVYFHNDRPNKDSWDTTTTLNYDTTYYRYAPRYEEYKKEFSRQFKGELITGSKLAVDTFFESYLFQGRKDLVKFTEELIQELDSGRSVEVLVQGFASPLTKSDYNVNLSLRRISSVMNFLAAYQEGVLTPYIQGTASNGAKLTYVKNPNGEYKAQKGVSDDYYDVSNSIYNPAAAKERKVELRASLVRQDTLPVLPIVLGENILEIAEVKKDKVNFYLHNTSSENIKIQGIFIGNTEVEFKGGFVISGGELAPIEIELPVDLIAEVQTKGLVSFKITAVSFSIF